MRALINGEEGELIGVSDRGLNYGDGCFTTIAVRERELQLWPRHWQRLQQTCARLKIPLVDEHTLLAEAKLLIEHHDSVSAVIKILISRGEGGRGYAPPMPSNSNRVVSISHVPSHYGAWQKQGIRIAQASFRLAIQPEFAGLKTLNRLEQVMLKQELQDLRAVMEPKPDDLIVSDADDYICETTMGNIFWRHNGQWHTPDLTNAGIEGVVRAELLAQNPQVRIGRYRLESLLQADEIFVCNALLGLVPVSNIKGIELSVRTYSKHWQTLL
ncbi:aminodeoxychorismate lyase [Aliidiomarina iranensis]|uniref:Aminodeoxychorismate lyase n=1 Tax=Aliidiomarina iranensis TaxID=1434071 RepID=A0A432W007_9GAMM|nr:aminodeoxychorismate lyase [Aliidiomarina iranensis]RUO22344.1 aminodeoxychorismate lyase [Aliidiomarina iranensis]